MEWEEYLVPGSLDEALEMLERYRGAARVIAGGTDIVPATRKGAPGIKALVDITRIPGLDTISLDGETVKIGPLVTHTEVALSGLIRERGMALAEGASRLGSPQIRNIGTVAGNIINAQPGADTVIPLLALDGSVTIREQAGRKDDPPGRALHGRGPDHDRQHERDRDRDLLPRPSGRARRAPPCGSPSERPSSFRS